MLGPSLRSRASAQGKLREVSVGSSRQTFRFAQGDKSFPVLLVKTHKKEKEMRAIVVSEFGGPEVLSVREVPAPEPGPGQVAIQVAYAGVNYAETMARRGGLHSGLLPFIPGLEVAGHI